MPKINPKSDENHSKKGLGRLREATKWARVAKKRSKSDLRRFLNDFWTVRGTLGGGLGAPKRAQERRSGAQEAPKSVPRALWKASCVKVCFDIVVLSFFLSILGWFRDRFLGEKYEEKVIKKKAIFGVFFEPFSLLVVFSAVA